MQNSHRKQEHGSAIFMILIGIALFAALSYSISQMMRDGKAEIIPAEQAKVYASQIVEYGNIVRQAVQNMRINGCDVTEISFTQASGDAYEHSPAVPTKCKLFEKQGGAVVAEEVSPGINDGSPYIFTGGHAANNVGTVCTNAACSDLIMVLEQIDKSVCLALNKQLGVSNPSNDAPNDAGGTLARFTGTYTYGNVLLDEDTALNGKMAGCLRDTPANTYSYFKVLIAR